MEARRKASFGSGSRRAGFSLFEMLVAMTLFGSLMAVAISVLNQQVRTFNNGAAGAGVPSGQPQPVYADSNMVVFNANWMSNISGDPFSVHVDSTMPNNWVLSVPKSRAFTIPTTAVVYPDTTYFDLDPTGFNVAAPYASLTPPGI